jgi:hypothetical protein
MYYLHFLTTMLSVKVSGGLYGEEGSDQRSYKMCKL